MTPETTIELALYRVADRLGAQVRDRRARFPRLDSAISDALRAVGEEIASIERNRRAKIHPSVYVGKCCHGVALDVQCDQCKQEHEADAAPAPAQEPKG